MGLSVTLAAVVIPTKSGVGFKDEEFLVGSGAALYNGCTTGHGDCGLARLSYRSLIAMLTFMPWKPLLFISPNICFYGVKSDDLFLFLFRVGLLDLDLPFLAF